MYTTALGCTLAALLVNCSSDATTPAPGTSGASSQAGAGALTQSGGGASGGSGFGASGAGTPGFPVAGAGGQVSSAAGAAGSAEAMGGTGGGAAGAPAGAGGSSAGAAGDAGGSSAGAGSAGMNTGGAGGSTHSGTWKVLMLGDSVTGNYCYPQLLSKQLIAGAHTNFTLIGTVTNNNGCGNGVPIVKSEGHGGYGVTYLPANSQRGKCTKQAQGCGSYAELQTWAAEKPDIVLMHFATNDCWDHMGNTLILAAYQAVLAEFRKQNPKVIFFVSKIIPLGPAPQEAINLNAAVTPAWAMTNSTATSPVQIIDHWTGFNTATDANSDGVHPNLMGAQKMATASFNALVAAGYF